MREGSRVSQFLAVAREAPSIDAFVFERIFVVSCLRQRVLHYEDTAAPLSNRSQFPWFAPGWIGLATSVREVSQFPGAGFSRLFDFYFRSLLRYHQRGAVV